RYGPQGKRGLSRPCTRVQGRPRHFHKYRDRESASIRAGARPRASFPCRRENRSPREPSRYSKTKRAQPTQTRPRETLILGKPYHLSHKTNRAALLFDTSDVEQFRATKMQKKAPLGEARGDFCSSGFAAYFRTIRVNG